LTLFSLAQSLIYGNVSKLKPVFNFFWLIVDFIFGLLGTFFKNGPTKKKKKKKKKGFMMMIRCRRQTEGSSSRQFAGEY